jgi:LytS/YehU family sensor histidine kinase
MILQLSDMLRYVLDKMEAESVPLKEEVAYLQNYVDMQKNRLNDPQKVRFNIVGNMNGYAISPLLLINFLENCFKHADLQKDSGFIRMNLSLNDRHLKLTTRNTIRGQIDDVEESSGLGIENARKRLELAYPNAYSLDISEDNQHYEINLNIDLKV